LHLNLCKTILNGNSYDAAGIAALGSHTQTKGRENQMTDERKNIDGAAQEASESDKPESLGRRALLRGGAKAMPAILTLQSGAALAQSSNLIASAPAGTRDTMGRALCLDTTTVDPVSGSTTVFDLGNPPRAVVNAITERNYKTAANNGADDATEDDICAQAGTYYWKDPDQPWQELTMANRGVVVSSAAVFSFSDSISGDVM
jgi:hypothetical protein